MEAPMGDPVVGWSPDRPTSRTRECVTCKLVRLTDAWAGRETTAVNIFKGRWTLVNRNPKRKRGIPDWRFSLAYASGYDGRRSTKPGEYGRFANFKDVHSSGRETAHDWRHLEHPPYSPLTTHYYPLSTNN